MLTFFKTWLRSRRRLLCNHDHQVWVRDIYGDEINHTGKRSVWRCEKCGAYITNEVLSRDYERGETTTEICVYHWMGKRDRAALGLDENGDL